jgi:hypothetical protein
MASSGACITYMIENDKQNVVAQVFEASHAEVMVQHIPQSAIPSFYRHSNMRNEQQGTAQVTRRVQKQCQGAFHIWL